MRQTAATFACHLYGIDDAVLIGAAVSAAAAAASAAQQQAAAARKRRADATAAQQAKQGMPGSSSPPGSIAESLLGQVGNVGGRIQDMFKESKPVGDATAGSPALTGQNGIQSMSLQDMAPTQDYWQKLLEQQNGQQGY